MASGEITPEFTFPFSGNMGITSNIRIPQELLPSFTSGQHGFPDSITHQIDLGGDLQTTPNYFPMIQSGSVATGRDHYSYCNSCDVEVPVGNGVRVTGGSGGYWCHKCAGFDPNKGGFGWQREEWIRSTYAFSKDTSAGIIADYLEDHGRTEDANYMRSRSK